MRNPKFKAGEWCFCEFTLQLVKKTEEDRITSVTDGYFELGSRDLTDRCFPLTINIKRISNHIEYYSKKLHEIKTGNLNHPDLNRELIRRWVEMCENSENNEFIQARYDANEKFYKDILNAIKNFSQAEVEGIRLLR